MVRRKKGTPARLAQPASVSPSKAQEETRKPEDDLEEESITKNRWRPKTSLARDDTQENLTSALSHHKKKKQKKRIGSRKHLLSDVAPRRSQLRPTLLKPKEKRIEKRTGNQKEASPETVHQRHRFTSPKN